MSTPTAPVTALDRRIIGALQVDGRASWRTIAAVLGEAERTVTRRGTALLESGLVTVTGLVARGDAVIVRARCAPGTARLCAQSLAGREDTTFSYLLTGTADVVAELLCPPNRLAGLVLDELPATPGVASCWSTPVLHYYRTVHDWQPALITEAEAAELRAVDVPAVQPAPAHHPGGGAREERAILRALVEDGRRTYEELARIAGVSEPTARRRLEALRRDGRVYIRAVVDPAVIGLPVEALLWITTSPSKVDRVGKALLTSPYVRYVSALMGTQQLLADVTLPDLLTLQQFTTRSDWADDVESLESSLVVASLKRSGVVQGAGRSVR